MANRSMMRVFEKLPYEMRKTIDEGSISLTFDFDELKSPEKQPGGNTSHLLESPWDRSATSYNFNAGLRKITKTNIPISFADPQPNSSISKISHQLKAVEAMFQKLLRISIILSIP